MRKVPNLTVFVFIAISTGIVIQCSQPVVDDLVDAALDGDLDGALDGALDGDLDTGPSDALAQDADGSSSSEGLRLERFSGVLDEEGSLEFQIPDYNSDNHPPLIQLFIEGRMSTPDGVWWSGGLRVSEGGVVSWGPSEPDAGHRWQLVIIR